MRREDVEELLLILPNRQLSNFSIAIKMQLEPNHPFEKILK